jgi:CRISPR/Cas system CSM-associated protein Csm3 (group 7 of RAMP superfamily)
MTAPRITLLRVTLTLTTAGGVTAPQTDDPIKLPLAREPEHRGGRPYIPPTSLAGGLRAHLGEDADLYLGPAVEQADLRPSPVRVLGSEVTMPEGTLPTVVRSTAIDPERGAARAGTLRSQDLLPGGTTVRCFLRCDDPALADELTRRLQTWQPVIGRGRTTGRGRAAVSEIAVRVLDLGTRDGLAAWLLHGRDGLFPAGPKAYTRVLSGLPIAPDPVLRLEFVVQDALAVGSGAGTVFRLGNVASVPGSAWKGVLRSRCTYILRSCGVLDCDPDAPCGGCPVCRLFGYTRRGAAPGEPTGAAGLLEFSDATIRGGTVRTRNHVAIDRFTGGARTGLLFTHEAVVGGTVTAEIHTRAPLDAADRGLLLLAARDIHDGLVGIGGHTTRGFGTLRLDDTSRPLLEELRPDHPVGAATLTLLAAR